MTAQQLLAQGRKSLPGEDAALEAWILYEEAFQMSRSEFWIHAEEEVDPEKAALYERMLRRRRQGEPVAYIIGSWEFMGLPFQVSPAVLIPRPDTETLVEAVLEWLPERKKASILDLCTGSGCIAVSLAHFRPCTQVLASDLSPEALAVAAANAKQNGVCVSFCQGDLWQPLPAGRQYDIITCNPPYIDRRQLQQLDRDVIAYEPHMALDGGEDGLTFYRRLAEQVRDYLKDGGRIFWEIGYDQAEAVSRLLEDRGMRVCAVRRDLAGRSRVVIAEKE